ncbi:hypothetical protein DXG01_005817 [Tephrocybe rancida]|nr:hypothetical protein DXG01_005817 [Tephrocybe rancida]
MIANRLTPDQLAALAKKLAAKVTNDLAQYASEYPKDDPAMKERSVLKERTADLHSIAVKVVAVSGFDAVILHNEPFHEQMFELSKYLNDLKYECDQSRQDFTFGELHSAIYRCLKEFKENRKIEQEKAKLAAEKAAAEKEKEPPAKRTRGKRIPKKSATYIVDSDEGEDVKMFLPKCKTCADKHAPADCPGQSGLQETIADAYRCFDRLLPHTPIVLMNDAPADGVYLEAQRELVERVKGMCQIYDFLAAQRISLRKRPAASEHEEASSAKAAKLDDEDTEMAEDPSVAE